MSKIFGEHKELRFLGWCANYTMEIDSAGIIFTWHYFYIYKLPYAQELRRINEKI